MPCARIHGLPLSDTDRKRFGIEDEWCTPEISATLRAKLGVDAPPAAQPELSRQ